MFGIGKKSASPPEPQEEQKPAGKGRPTRTRKEAEAERYHPLIPADRKAAQRELKAKRREAQDRTNAALQTGEERYLPARDKGPVRRWVRDYVDARTTPQEFVMFLMIGMFAVYLAFAKDPVIMVVIALGMYVIVFGLVAYMVWFGLRMRKRLRAKFGAEAIPKGTIMYGVTRSMSLRRTRLPKPQVQRGQFPK